MMNRTETMTCLMTCFLVFVIGCLSFFVGCDEHRDGFSFSCDMQKVDGKVISLSVTMPYERMKPNPLTLDSRENVQKLIDSLESLILDLELARDQMSVKEPEI